MRTSCANYTNFGRFFLRLRRLHKFSPKSTVFAFLFHFSRISRYIFLLFPFREKAADLHTNTALSRSQRGAPRCPTGSTAGYAELCPPLRMTRGGAERQVITAITSVGANTAKPPSGREVAAKPTEGARGIEKTSIISDRRGRRPLQRDVIAVGRGLAPAAVPQIMRAERR